MPATSKRPSRPGRATPTLLPLPARHPAALLATFVAAACVLVSVSFVLYETDFWQHLLVGKVIWQTHAIPQRQIWIWPHHGAPDITPSWLFRVLLWPFWAAGGVWGLFAWRWLTTLAAFAVLGWTARRMGARGLAGLVALVLVALAYRQRSQIRPETLVAILMSLEIAILESRRHGGPDRCGWLVPIAWVWANTHISYVFGFAIIALYGIGGEYPVPGAAKPPPPRRLILAGLAAVAISFVNPYGWRALAQPFEYTLFWRHEPIFQTIGELQPIRWAANWKNGLPLVVFGWPALIVWRWRRGRPDMIEAMICAMFTAVAAQTQRFVGFHAVAAGAFLARDLDDWVSTWPRPRWSTGAWARGVLASAVCVAVCIPEWRRPEMPLGVGIDMRRFPVAACDFMAAHGVRGRGFAPFYFGGYMLWRFWPDPSRLPFMDIHQSGTHEDRLLYALAGTHPESWRALDGRYRFDYILWNRVPSRSEQLLDGRDHDPAWALVFLDDAAAVYVRRDGPLARLADSLAYPDIPAGRTEWPGIGERCRQDTLYRARVRAELEREVAASPFNGGAHGYLANLDMMDGRLAGARAHLEQALARDPLFPTGHDRLGRIALMERRPREALREFEAERAIGDWAPGLDIHVGEAWEALGDPRRAAAAYRRALARDPGNSAARAALEAVERRMDR